MIIQDILPRIADLLQMLRRVSVQIMEGNLWPVPTKLSLLTKAVFDQVFFYLPFQVLFVARKRRIAEVERW